MCTKSAPSRIDWKWARVIIFLVSGDWSVHRDDIGASEDLFQRDAAYIEQAGVFLADIRVIDRHIAVEWFEQADDAAADHAGADEPHFFGVK